MTTTLRHRYHNKEKLSQLQTREITAFLRAGNPCKTPLFAV